MSLEKLPIHETFYSLQGEGAHTGTPAHFIRLAGCDVGCVWCDVNDSWDIAKEQYHTIGSIVDEAKESASEVVIVTGGEPTMHSLVTLTSELKEAGKKTHIETAGTSELTGEWDWVCFSPKKFKKPLPSIYEKAHELKVVIFHPSDIQWAEEHASKINSDCKLFLQLEWSKKEKLFPIVFEYIKNNPRWQLSVQTHKYLSID